MPHSGKITFWEKLSDATDTDPSRQRQKCLQGGVHGLFSGETITDITEAEPRGFVLTLSSGRLVHLSINIIQGRQSIKADFMPISSNQNTSFFGSLRGVFGGTGWKPLAGVKAGRSAQRGQRYIITGTTSGVFQVWDLGRNGIHTLVYETNTNSDLLRAFNEGAKLRSSRNNVAFELLDFSLVSTSHRSRSREHTRSNSGTDYDLLLLVALKGLDGARYTLIDLTLSNESSSVHVVRPIKRYTSSLSEGSLYKPQLIVPQPEYAAFIAFEESLVVISLENAEETPSSQLQMEAYTLPEPFEDTVRFRKDKGYRVVASAADGKDNIKEKASCVLAVHGAGLIRIVVEPMREGHSFVSRAAVTARKKIEQAVFYSSVSQNVIDFTPREEDEFSREDIEKAALDVSRSITSSTSPYLRHIALSVKKQLAKRSAALANLIKHVQGYQVSLRLQNRWKLMWDAEKLAAAEALWHWYEDDVAGDTSGRRELFAEMVEAIPETLKLENRPEYGQTDGVRHWFTHDVWRLEWVIPYGHEIVEILFRESVEDKREIDAIERARMVAAAVDIQLSTLETAYRFREANAALYGLRQDTLVDGVLQSPDDFKTVPEFWTSSSLGQSPALVPTRVKELAELSREMAKLLANDVEDYLEQQGEEGQVEIDLDDTHAAMTELTGKCARQIEICCRVFVERYRWLQSQTDQSLKEQGNALSQAHQTLRRRQFVELLDLNMAEQAVDLAERYQDMDALLDIFEHETEESNSIGPSIPHRIEEYFLRYGVRWADVFFSRSLRDGKTAVDILNNNAAHGVHLRKFLRTHPNYSNMTWINEVSTERDYSNSAAFLDRAARQNTNLWAQKTMLSLSKLSLQAAKSKGQVTDEIAQPVLQRTDGKIDILRIQGSLYDSLEPLIHTAIDSDAAVDVVVDHHGLRTVEERPYLRSQLQGHLQEFLSGQALNNMKLANLLSLLHEDSLESKTSKLMSRRFFLGLRSLKLLSKLEDVNINCPAVSLMANILWRRVLIASDWTKLNRTESRSDAQVSCDIADTALFQTFIEGYRTISGAEDEDFWVTMLPPASPIDVLGIGVRLEDLRPLAEDLQIEEEDLASFAKDLAAENENLQLYIDKGRLGEWYKGVMEAAKTAAKEEVTPKTTTGEMGQERIRSRMTNQRDVPPFDVHEDVNGNATDAGESVADSDGDLQMDG